MKKLIKLALLILFLLSFVYPANAATIDLVRSTVGYTDLVDQSAILEFLWNTPSLNNEEVRYLIGDIPSEFDVSEANVQISSNMGTFDKAIKSSKIALKSTTTLNGNLEVKIKIPIPSDCPENTYSLEISEMVGSDSDMLSPSSIGIAVQKSSTKPSTPTLNDLGTTDTDGSYTVSWSSVSGATSYTLEEDTSGSFSSPTVVHSDAGTSKYITGKSDGTYYYRVKACNAGGCSGWSNVEDIAVEIGNVITVDDSGGADYTTIQEAVNNAGSGYTIKVFSGNYSEHVVIDKSLKLIGENKDTTIIVGGGNGSCAHVTADNVEISGFTIMNCFEGVYVESSKGIIIDNNIISDNFDGIYLVNSDSNTITHNVITNNIWYVSGIHLISSTNNTISNNDIVGNDKGVYLYNSINNLIYHNNFINNTCQAYDNTGTNSWDNGYPSGGNYWNDYMGSDAYSGADQNVPSSDGIGDTAYSINSDKDNYPLMERFENYFEPPSPLKGKIVFHSNRDNNFEIYVMDADGTNQTRLTRNVGNDQYAVWSSDSTKIAFTSEKDGNQEIYVMNPDWSNQVRLTFNNASDWIPDFSPDSKKIVFTSNCDRKNAIYIMNSDGSNQIRLTENDADDRDPDWSINNKIAFESNRDGKSEIYVMDADGTNVTRLTDSNAVDRHPAWSPDGSRIAFTSNRDGNDEIYVMNADGDNRVRITYNTASDLDPAWSLDGNYIAFASNRDGNYEIYVMNVDGGNQRKLTVNTNEDYHPDWGLTVSSLLVVANSKTDRGAFMKREGR